MAKQKKAKQIRTGTVVAAWMSDDELVKIDTMVERLHLDRSKVIKLLVLLYTPDELLARYVASLVNTNEGPSSAAMPPQA